MPTSTMRAPSILALLILSAPSALSAPQSTVLHFTNVRCGPDLHIIIQSLTSLKGVDKVEVSLEDQTATVSYDTDFVTIDKLEAAVGVAGFPAQSAAALTQ